MPRVVVLEDNEVMRQVIKDIVAFLGHDVQTFDRVSPFIESVQIEPADRVIVDAMLAEEVNGLEVIEKVRQLPGMEDSRFVLLTASTAIIPLRDRLQERQIEVLSKPCSIDELEFALA